MKIVPFENAKFVDDECCIDSVKITFSQNHDCTESDDVTQTLTVETRNNGCARFLAISTDEGKNWWSIDNVNELVDLLNLFKKKAELK